MPSWVAMSFVLLSKVFCWKSCGKSAYCRGLHLHHRWCQVGSHSFCAVQDSYKVRFPFCFQSLRQSVCCLSAEKSFVLSYISVFRCLWLAVSTPPTCLTFNYFGNGSIAFHIVFTCYEIRCQLRKTCCSLSCQSPFRLPHASASSKMSFNTMIGSLNLTDFIWCVAFICCPPFFPLP